MTAKQIAQKISILQQAYKKETLVGVKKKIKEKIAELKKQAKSSNVSTEQLAKSLLAINRRKPLTLQELAEAIKQLKPREEYAFLSTRDYRPIKKVERDYKRYAKPVGWRIKGKKNVEAPTPKQLAYAKKRGTAYYESRPDRSDVVRPAKLEQGGLMAKGGSSMPDYTKTMNLVKVKFNNPKYNYSTSVSSDVTESEARKYFVGKMFDVGVYPKENMQKAVDIEFFPKGTYSEEMAKGGKTKNASSKIITVHKPTIDEIIKEYKMEITKSMKEDSKYWSKEPRMLQMVMKDYEDHKEVIEKMKAGNYKTAYGIWAKMDTAARENITKSAYKLLMKKNNITFAKGGMAGNTLKIGRLHYKFV